LLLDMVTTEATRLCDVFSATHLWGEEIRFLPLSFNGK
jgi:hypothetical protein